MGSVGGDYKYLGHTLKLTKHAWGSVVRVCKSVGHILKLTMHAWGSVGGGSVSLWGTF